MKRNFLRNFIKGLSFTSVLFVFQACYGTQQDWQNDMLIEGRVTSILTNEPIPGIQVSVGSEQSALTDSEGNFSMFTYVSYRYDINISDIDGAENGLYREKELYGTYDSSYVFLEIQMEPDASVN